MAAKRIKVADDIRESSKETEFEWTITGVAGNEKTNHISPYFYFADNKWRLHFLPEAYSKPGFAKIGLTYKYSCKDYVQYEFGLKKLDGRVEQLHWGLLKKDDNPSSRSFYRKLSDILEINREMSFSNVLCIVCTLKRGSSVRKEQNHNKLIDLDGLSENIGDLMTKKDSCDVLLHVKDREFKAHKTILMARSLVFAAMFQHDTLEKQTGVINIPDCDPETFQEFLEYLYCGKIENISYRSAYHLYCTSHKYDVQKLEEFCVEILIVSLTSNNVSEVVILADKYDDAKLLSATQDFFDENCSKIFVTPEWKNLMRDDFDLANKLLIKMTKIKESQRIESSALLLNERILKK